MLSKNLHLCFTAIKKPILATSDSSSQVPLSEDDQFRSSSTATNTTATSCSGLVKNFNSLYDHTPESSASKSISRTSDDFSTSDSDTESTEPDFATIFASQRFFISSPGHSNSIIESSSGSSSSESSSCRPESDTLVVGGGVPCPTYSPDPYMDFRQSMQEMVESRKMSDVTSDWDFLHELLLCYLALNPKHAHKYIIGAFADLLITLMAADEEKKSLSSSDDPCTISR
ncbi:hypothetical protein ACHQM5_027514 [Ranunculus cassubicifolius]